MCGICGELRLDGSAADLETVSRMLPALARRGRTMRGSIGKVRWHSATAGCR